MAMKGADKLRVVTVNCNGLRGHRRRRALGRLLAVLRAGVRVVTESHLRRGDSKMLQCPDFPDHAVVSSFCRKAKNKKIGGGVVIMAHTIICGERKGGGGGR